VLPAPLLLERKDVKDRVVRINGVRDEVGSKRLTDDDFEGLAFFARTLAEEVVLAVREDGLDEWHMLWIMIYDILVPLSGWAEIDRHGEAEVGGDWAKRQSLASELNARL
jgi:hypothetical protein